MRTQAAPIQQRLKELPPGLWVVRSGGIAGLALQCVARLISPGMSWRREFVLQFSNVFALGAGPVFIVALLVGFAGTGVQGGATLEAFGAVDRLAAAVPVALLREGGPLIAGAVMAGVVGTTITAEFGARVIRDEIAALAVMGVDPIRSLVLPRVLAVTVGMVVLNMIGVLAGIVGAYVGVVGLLNASSGSFVSQLLASTNYLDLWASVLKSLVFGAMIGIIASWKGLSATSDTQGVGRAVNESVVANLIGIGVVGLVFTSIFFALYPDLMVMR